MNVYVDGFNLYYGALRNRPYRWLNLSALARALLRPDDTVNRVRYFTARVKALPHDPDAPARQAAYLRALGTLPEIELHFGTFLTNSRQLPLVDGRGTAHVLKTDEKGSDVNLATYLLVDAFDQEYETALVISNDSDLVEPIRLVQSRFPVSVGVVLPIATRNANGQPRKASTQLIAASAFSRKLDDSKRRQELLARSQFPDTLTDSVGSFTKPASW
ncbi:MAG: NYN domain-containing protein [Microbacteriaceae bacterium]|nr:NYN domain-containing protein [Microbacteriaceae bacterium]